MLESRNARVQYRSRTRSTWLALCVASACFGCSSSTPKPTAGPEPNAAGAATAKSGADEQPPREITLAAAGLDATALDRSVKPCDDFYRFACGRWIARTEIPADRSRWSRSFSEIFKRNEKVLHEILEQAARSTGNRKPSAGGSASKEGALASVGPEVTRKLGTFYRACMDAKALTKAGIRPLKPLLKTIARVHDAKSLTAAVTALHQSEVWALFELGATQDFKDATSMIGELDQAGLGLPDRDYYIKQDKRSKKLRGLYREHVARMLKLSGLSQHRAARGAARIMALETELAKVSKTRVERRDPDGMYNKIDRAGVEKTVPRFGWKSYLTALGRPKLEAINVTSVKFFRGVDRLIGKVKPADWKIYLRWHLLHANAGALSKPFVDEAFVLRKALTGQKKQRKRWKRCVEATDEALGELLAQPYIARRFPGESKQAARRMVLAISEAFGKRLGELSWMDPKTRAAARDKRQKMAYLIGYPPKWKHYPFAIGASYAANRLAARAYDLQRDLAKIGKPVDREEWEMSPPTVNAYYHPLKNHMVFPAGILQPPFYDRKAALAVNMGGMGMVVGHELTHGFDDQGSKFDAKGNLDNWWSKPVKKRFEKRTQCVVNQYAKYSPLPGIHLNGKLTAGENIADMGGVKLAYRAYRAMRAGKQPIAAGGFSEDQLFFLAVGQVWCSKYREERARMMVRVDPHSPPRFRVNGSLANLPEFAEAFTCKAGSAMNPPGRCELW